MQEAEHRMIRDDITADDMLQIAGTEEFPRPTGLLSHNYSFLACLYALKCKPSIIVCVVSSWRA